MASSRDTSNGPDEIDIAVFMSAFQGINKLKLSVELTVVDRGHLCEMQVQVTAWTLQTELTELPPSVLLSVRRPLEPRQTLNAAILQLLYLLDGRLAESEGMRTIKPA